jgi:hypothetical protein
MSDASARAAVLRACGILFLFRALHEAADGSRQAHIEAQIVDLIADFTDALGGAVVLGRSFGAAHQANRNVHPAVMITE